MDTEVYKLRESLPYEVQWGWQCSKRVGFANFELALSFYRSMLAVPELRPSDIRIVNVDAVDGADDANAAAQHGLTADEWKRVQEV